MKSQMRSDDKINDDIKTAGQSFLGMYMEDLICRINELDDTNKKEKLIYEYYSNPKEFTDRKCDGTRTRVNAAIRIIKADKVLYALEQIDGSNPRVSILAVENARKTINKIKCGELNLPHLY